MHNADGQRKPNGKPLLKATSHKSKVVDYAAKEKKREE